MSDLTLEARIHLALNSIEDDTITGNDLLRLLSEFKTGDWFANLTVHQLEVYLLDQIDEDGCLPGGEYDLFEICGCNNLIVWDALFTEYADTLGGYRHVRDGKFKCEER